MTINVNILASIEAETYNATIEDHQGPAGSKSTDPVVIVTTGDRVVDRFMDVAASAIVTLWDKDETHGVDTPSFMWIIPTVDGILEWATTDEAANDDVNTITMRKDVPYPLAGDSVGNKLQARSNYTTIDALGTGATHDVTRVRFKSLNATSPGRVRVIGFK